MNVRNLMTIVNIYRKAFQNWPLVMLNVLIRKRACAIGKGGTKICDNSAKIGYIARIIYKFDIHYIVYTSNCSLIGYSKKLKTLILCKENNLLNSIVFYFLNNINNIRSIIIKDGFVSIDSRILIPIDEFMYSDNELIGIALKSGWSYDPSGRFWFRDGIKFRHIHWPIIETFNLGQYDFMNVYNKVILDIGAFVGDSSIYFALKGARLVYAVEPLPSNYDEMVQNIELNGLSDKVIPIKLIISYSDHRIKVPYSTDIHLRGGSIYDMLKRPYGGYEYVNALTLKGLYESLAIKPNVLKMDCEGCEFDIILNDYETIKRFDEIIFEYHSYITGHSIYELMNILNRHFKCTFMKEEFYKKYFSNYTRDQLGMIYCIRVT